MTIIKDSFELLQTIGECEKAILINPYDQIAWTNLLFSYSKLGNLTKLKERLLFGLNNKFIDLKRGYHLFHLNYIDSFSPEELFKYHQMAGLLLERHIPQLLLDSNTEDKAVLRVGYISGDLNNHPVAFFLFPILQMSSPKIKSYCYSNGKFDYVSEQLKKYVVEWKQISDLDDTTACNMIIEDQIDILVDLSGYTGSNRLGIFAKKPAPVQVTYLGYPNTTGFNRIDYRIVDAYTNPPQAPSYSTEMLMRLPHSFLCYLPPSFVNDTLNISSPPSSKNGYITFGSFNNISKINENTINTWSQIIRETANAQLVIKSDFFKHAEVKDYYLNLFTHFGVRKEQIRFVSERLGRLDFFKLYNEIDIALDPFPYNGTTTTCETLYMGVPVIILVGERHSARVGYSILSQLKLDECIAFNQNEYVEKSLKLAHAPETLIPLRTALRSRLLNSPLCNAALFAENLTQAYFKMWENHINAKCSKSPEIVNSDNLKVYLELAHKKIDQNLPSEAMHLCEKILSQDTFPYKIAYCYLATLSRTGHFEEIYDLIPNLLKKTNYASTASHLFYLNCLPNISADEITKHHIHYGKEITKLIKPGPRKSRQDSNKTLRVGYISGDFFQHPVSNFLINILSFTNRQCITSYCYYLRQKEDAVTKQLQRNADEWRNVYSLSKEQVIKQIQEDNLDILVDLSGHTANNASTVLIEKPAPIQVNYLGYPCTTGLPQIDYRIVDHYTDPPESNSLATERLIRLPHCFLCYSPPTPSPDINAAPLRTLPDITFGSLNGVHKLNKNVIELWAQLYKKCPAVRFILKDKCFNDPYTKKRYYRFFEDAGVPKDRVNLLAYEPDMMEHFNTYNSIDIALDPFPYNGTTTTCEALWMGVPMITLVGDRHCARVGYSILSQMELQDCIAFTPEEYVDKALSLAKNPDRLISLRQNLRSWMIKSHLCNANAFCRSLEDAFKKMWMIYIDSNPESPKQTLALAKKLRKEKKFEEAAQKLEKKLSQTPEDVSLLCELGNCYLLDWLPTKALATYLRIKPSGNIHGLKTNLIASYLYSSRVDEACKLALEDLGNLETPPHLLTFCYSETLSKETIFQAHEYWGKCIENKIPMRKKLRKELLPDKQLKIGYVSADFAYGSVIHFLLPILYSKGGNITNICYSNVKQEDFITSSLKQLDLQWRNIRNVSDENVCKLIENDDIDILVDLGGHVNDNRISLFAHKPAPIQISYLGYPNTTGLKRIDYRLVDNFTDPEYSTKYATEKLIRLPHSFICYAFPTPTPEIASPPFIENGFITFGSLNNPIKINASVIKLWARLLNLVPKSNLLLKGLNLKDPEIKQHFWNSFKQHGIAKERILLYGFTDNSKEHLSFYNKIDIALDPFPYNGTTTTCEALWMGVPVITLVGDRHSARVGYSILSQLELNECIAFSSEEYIEKALYLVTHPEAIVEFRNSLRSNMEGSLLCNCKTFAYNLEEIYRTLWQRHVSSAKAIFIAPEEALEKAFRYTQQLRIEEAIEILKQLIENYPENPSPWMNWIQTLLAVNKTEEAVEICHNALKIFPNNVIILSKLLSLYTLKKNWVQTVYCLERILVIEPNNTPAINQLANIHFNNGSISISKTYLSKLTDKDSLVKLGICYFILRSYEKAFDAFKKLMEDDYCSYYLSFLNLTDNLSSAQLFESHCQWGKDYEAKYTQLPVPLKKHDKTVLNIAYLSPNFYEHSIAYFLLPILSQASSKIKNHCYTTSEKFDSYSFKIKELSNWRSVSDKTDIEICELIQEDGIDILVDLAGHSFHNRLSIFALKPAPIQVSYLGYPNTTGLSRIDYRIVDNFTDPLNGHSYNSEKLIHLPSSFVCYAPPNPSPPVIPSIQQDGVIFGSFNAIMKVNEAVIVLWSKLLRALPSSKMVLKYTYLCDPQLRSHIELLFELEGVSKNRLKLLRSSKTVTEHLSTYNTIDIALDPFPYNGTTTTCEALWMGVPVVTLVGNRHAGRVGYSILSQLGLEECIAFTEEEYIEKTIALAMNPKRLTFLREQLRSTMASSPLCNAKEFTTSLENAYHEMWNLYLLEHETREFVEFST